MKVITLSCNQCGAPLEVSKRAQYVTCNFCTARLQIKHEDGSSWTEEVEELRSEVKNLKTREAVREYDQRWVEARKQYMNRNKKGEYSAPSKFEATLIFLFFSIPLSISQFFRSESHFMGYLVITLGVIYTLVQYAKADRFSKAKARYWDGRRRLLEKLRESP